MLLNIKKWTFFALCCFTTTIQAQKESAENHNSILHDDHYGIFEIGPYYPLALGDNFAHKGMEQHMGGQFSFAFNLSDSPFLLGFTINSFGADNTDEARLGLYNRTTITAINATVGYHILYKKHWRITINAGVGSANYRNYSGNYDFSDTGWNLTFVPSISYQFIKNIGVYLSPSFRRDFLHIYTPQELRKFFNGATYLSISAGIRIVI